MRGLVSRAVLLVFVGAAATGLRATQTRDAGITVDPSLYRAVYYRPLSVFSRGGRVTAVTGVPSKPALFYMGAAGGGVWRSSESGRRGGPLTDGPNRPGTVRAIKSFLLEPHRLFVATRPPGTPRQTTQSPR